MLLLVIFWFSFVLSVYFLSEPINLLILLEIFSVSFILLVSNILIIFELSFLYFFVSLVFLVCESVVGFLLFVVYITFNCFCFIVYDYINNLFSVLALFMSLVGMPIVNNILIFYLMFELLFILIIFSILLLGYSLERLIVEYLILFYSFLFSSPSLFILVIVDNSFFIIGWLNLDILLLSFLVFSFIVKFPIFSFHYLLSVAYVEASAIGGFYYFS